MKKIRSRPWFYILLSFLIAFGFRLLFLPMTHTMSISGDEIFSFWPAAKAAGFDWSGVMETYRYYGFGYSLLLYPFFRWIHDPVLLYRSLVVLMMLAQSVVAPISYHLMKRYFNVSNVWVLFFGSLACSFLVSIRAIYTYPEFIYDLMVWICVWILLKTYSIHDIWKKVGYTFLLLLSIVYAYSVHARGITLVLGLGIAVLFYLWVYHKSPVSLTTLVAVSVAGLAFVQWGMKTLLTSLEVSGTSVANTEAISGIGGIIASLKEPETWYGFFNIIMGQLNEAIANTNGLAIFIVMALFYLIWKALLRKRTILKGSYNAYILIGVFCLSCVAITIGGMALKAGSGMAWVMLNHGDLDAYRQITYYRYYAAYIGPLLMLGIAYFSQELQILNQWKNKALLLLSLFQTYWIFCIVPFIYNLMACAWSYAQYSFSGGVFGEARTRIYLLGTVGIFIFFFLYYYLIVKKKSKWILPIFCVFLMTSYTYNCLFHEGARAQANWKETEQEINFLETAKNEFGLESVQIERSYLSLGGQGSEFIYQYHLPDMRFNELKENQNLTGDVVIISKDTGKKNEKYTYYDINSNELMGVKTKVLVDLANTLGLKEV